MSNIFYPLSVISKLQLAVLDRTVKDVFEDGGTYARNTWGLNMFKRQFQIQHPALTLQEWNALRSFWVQRTGQYDPFWFRNNIDRTGNAQVRFAKSLQPLFAGNQRSVAVDLEEVAAIRALPELDEVTAAAGTAPLVWWDANREKYLVNLGTIMQPESANLYDVTGAYPGTWQAGSISLQNILGQWQNYGFDGTRWGKSAAIPALNGVTAATIFCQAKIYNTVNNKTVIYLGAGTAATQLGLIVTPFANWTTINGSGTGATLTFSGAFTNWRSVALTQSGTTAKIYWNGTLIATDTISPGLSFNSSAVFSIGSDGGSDIVGAGSSIAHPMCFSSALSDAQITALHNLFASQQGL